MAEAILVGPNIDAGGRLIGDIRQRGIRSSAAAGGFDADRDRWKLHIVAPWPHGPDGNPYRALTEFFGPRQTSLRLDDIVAHRPNTRFAEALTRLGNEAGPAVRRVNDRYVEGVFFPEAIVYGLRV